MHSATSAQPGARTREEVAGPRRVVVLGSTGSIGMQTLEAIEHLNGLAHEGRSRAIEVVGLAAGNNHEGIREQVLRTGAHAWALANAAPGASGPTYAGPGAAENLVRALGPDLVVSAMVGVAGLRATLAAVELGIDVALANKETLVAAGGVIVPAARRTGARLIPIDSEHSGLWQCLQGIDHGRALVPPCATPSVVERALLTASGGPFREWPLEAIRHATPEQALSHPTWRMGRKNTIDSATMVNKGLELLEAHWLFDLGTERLGVLVHPQSVVHAIVELADGSSLAQLSAPDMRCPIQYALTWPSRAPGCSRRVSWRDLSRLEFAEPDAARFPAIGLAMEAIRRGTGVAYSAANEVAVEAFLSGAICFGRIVELVREVCDRTRVGGARTLEEVLALDEQARAYAREAIARGR